MTLLQQRMIEDMTMRGLAKSTQHASLRAVRDLAASYKCSPDTLSTRAIQRYSACSPRGTRPHLRHLHYHRPWLTLLLRHDPGPLGHALCHPAGEGTE